MAAPVTTYHYDNGRTGWNQHEITLTPANVVNLVVLSTVALDEQVNAQPLFVPGMTIAGGRHSVVYVATANNTIYALDAATGAILLQTNFGAGVPQSALPGQCNNNSTVVGITSTPVIDLTLNTLYVMVYTYENSTPIYRLHALDLATLSDKVSPAVVTATATLSDRTSYTFQAAYSRQRAALVEANGNIYAAFSSFCDLNPNYARGWLLGWNAVSLAPLAANMLTDNLIPAQSPNDFFLSSIWMSGSGPAVDFYGNLFFATGNSDWSGTTWNHIYNLSESVVKISPDLSTVLSFFTPWGPSFGVESSGSGGHGFRLRGRAEAPASTREPAPRHRRRQSRDHVPPRPQPTGRSSQSEPGFGDVSDRLMLVQRVLFHRLGRHRPNRQQRRQQHHDLAAADLALGDARQ